jgi:hypothetical protein
MNHSRTSTHAGRTALAALALAAAAVFPASALASSRQAGATPRGIKICGTISGPHWSYKGAGGTRYVVYTQHKAACPFALKWAPRLVGKRASGPGYQVGGAPAGWACSISSLHFGNCVAEVGGVPVPSAKAFAWAGKP